MTTLVRRPHAPSLVDLFDWVEDGILEITVEISDAPAAFRTVAIHQPKVGIPKPKK